MKPFAFGAVSRPTALPAVAFGGVNPKNTIFIITVDYGSPKVHLVFLGIATKFSEVSISFSCPWRVSM